MNPDISVDGKQQDSF